MQISAIVKTLLLTGVVLLSLDAIYITTMKNMFEIQIAAVQRVALQFRILGAVMCYILLIAGLYYFILRNHRPISDAFFLGILIYGVYDSTNYATLKQWKWETVAIDTLWGGILFALTTEIVYLAGI
uniref:DUF2177 family protein n=1 Tax=viral metagenome TaxID=1070528 RepID=A0A6C0HIZ0_9ZZZZ